MRGKEAKIDEKGYLRGPCPTVMGHLARRTIYAREWIMGQGHEHLEGGRRSGRPQGSGRSGARARRRMVASAEDGGDGDANATGEDLEKVSRSRGVRALVGASPGRCDSAGHSSVA